MLRYFSSLHPIAATVAVSGFAVGLVSAYGAYDADRRAAAAEVRSAAAALTMQHEDLDAALTNAQVVASTARGVDEHDGVAKATEDLDRALEHATAAAQEALAVARPGVEAFASVSSAEPEADLPPIVVEGAEPVDATQHGDTEDQTPVQSSEPSPAPSPSATAVTDAAPVPAPTVAGLDLDAVIEQASQDPDAARATAERLERASDALDKAKAVVATEAASVEQIVQAVEHDLAVEALDADVSEATATLEEAATLTDAVGERVDGIEAVSAALTAQTKLKSAVIAADAADRENADAVAAARSRLAATHTGWDDARTQLRASHENWVTAENKRREELNKKSESAYAEKVAEARKEHAEANRAAVAKRQNGWKGRPTGVQGSNGRVSASSLCAVDFAPGHRLQCDAAAALEEADAAYHAETGRHLSITDSYRSYRLQVTTRWRKPATAAVPGTSNHGWGMAVDMDHESARWLANNGAEYGWVHPRWARPGGSKPEWWHLEYVATDVGAFVKPVNEDLLPPVRSVFDKD